MGFRGPIARGGSEPGARQIVTQQDRILAFVAEHPGCTAPEVQAALGGSSGTQVASLAVRGQLSRTPDGPRLTWRYKAKATP